jgi:hypothetical protein
MRQLLFTPKDEGGIAALYSKAVGYSKPSAKALVIDPGDEAPFLCGRCAR